MRPSTRLLSARSLGNLDRKPIKPRLEVQSPYRSWADRFFLITPEPRSCKLKTKEFSRQATEGDGVLRADRRRCEQRLLGSQLLRSERHTKGKWASTISRNTSRARISITYSARTRLSSLESCHLGSLQRHVATREVPAPKPTMSRKAGDRSTVQSHVWTHVPAARCSCYGLCKQLSPNRNHGQRTRHAGSIVFTLVVLESMIATVAVNCQVKPGAGLRAVDFVQARSA